MTPRNDKMLRLRPCSGMHIAALGCTENGPAAPIRPLYLDASLFEIVSFLSKSASRNLMREVARETQGAQQQAAF